MSREIKFRAWVKHTKDLRWEWAYKEAEKAGMDYDETSDLRSRLVLKWDEEHIGLPRYEITHFMDYSDNVSISCSGKFMSIFNCEVIAFQQYTGLKDNNGKEIYEGDILEIDGGNPTNVAIVFHDGSFCIEAPWLDAESNKIELRHYTLFAELGNDKAFKDCIVTRVVGNIFENPELLKGENQ